LTKAKLSGYLWIRWSKNRKRENGLESEDKRPKSEITTYLITDDISSFMNAVELYVGLALYIGSTLSIIMIFRESGNKLEVRANSVSRAKKPIVSRKYIDLIEKTIERFKSTRTLSEELEQEYESISYVRFRLNHFTDELTEIVDSLTKSIGFGVISVVFIIAFGYALSQETDVISFWAAIGFGALAVITFYRYATDGLGQIRPLRRFEKLVNEIDRCDTFDQLNKSLSNQD
jgi:hypothetical protein